LDVTFPWLRKQTSRIIFGFGTRRRHRRPPVRILGVRMAERSGRCDPGLKVRGEAVWHLIVPDQADLVLGNILLKFFRPAPWQ
uniref:Uncharacterized protein n=1 Tax=Oryza brachyantha TaxID=4533 RepID=J3L1G6_ORYBR